MIPRSEWIKLAVIAIVIAVGTVLAGVLATHADTSAPSTPSSVGSSRDPGAVLRADLVTQGASMPASWAGIADANHALICANYAAHYAGWPSGHDEYGVTVPIALTALAESGFCS